MKYVFLFLAIISIIACNLSKNQKIISKWYSKEIEKVDGVSVTIKGLTEYKKDNSFLSIDTISTIYEGENIQLGNLSTEENNMIIIRAVGSWEIKNDFLISSYKESNLSIDVRNLNSSDKIIEISDKLLILEDKEHKVSTSYRIE